MSDRKLPKLPKQPKREQGAAFEYGLVRVGLAGKVELWVTVIVAPEALAFYLRAQAESVLPPGARYELREQLPTNFGKSKVMAWYHHETMVQRESWGDAPLGWVPDRGYYLVGQYVTPAAKAVM